MFFMEKKTPQNYHQIHCLNQVLCPLKEWMTFLDIYFFLSENRVCHINLHEIANPIFHKNKKKNPAMSSAEFAQRVLKVLPREC